MRKRIEASSLFETIVALMVTMLVFGIAITVYINVLRNSTSLVDFNASLRLDKIAKETKETKKYINESFEEGNMLIEKRVGKYQDKEGLILLELEAYNQSKQKLAEYKEVIIEEPNE